MCKVLQEIHDFKYAKTKLEKLLLWHDHNCRKMRDQMAAFRERIIAGPELEKTVKALCVVPALLV